jgi:6-phosphofructokinase 1
MKIGLLTSGGDAPGMNAAIRTIVRKAAAKGWEVFGFERGYSGILAEKYQRLGSSDVSDILQRGGTVLKTARCPEFATEIGQKKANEILSRIGLDGLIIIGGDGSFRGAQVLNQMGYKTIGIPATIDNDIGCTDYSIGFDTAVNTVLDAMNKIRDTAASHNRVYVVEVMGKNSGFIGVAAGLYGGAEAILIPEAPCELNDVCQRLIEGIARGKSHSVIIVAEGFFGPPETNVVQSSAVRVGQYIASHTDCEMRITILGHIQRGGNPTFFDRKLATLMAAKAIDLLEEGQTEMMVGIVGDEIKAFPMETAINTKQPVNWCEIELFNIISST